MAAKVSITGSEPNDLPDSLSFSEAYFLGRLSEELSDMIAGQAAAVFDQAGLVIPIKSCSLMLAIEAMEPASAKTLAVTLARSHQLVSQKLPKLLKLGLLSCEQDPEDLRLKQYRLTDYGREQMRIFHDLEARLVAAYQALDDDIGGVIGPIKDTLVALQKRPLTERV